MRSRADRRGVLVSLTDEGREMLDRQGARMRARRLAFFQSLPDGERELVADLLVRLSGLIDELGAGPDEV